MKTFIAPFIVLCVGLEATATTGPTVKVCYKTESIEMVSGQDFVLSVVTKVLKNSNIPYNQEEVRGKKAQQNAAIVLQGLAQSCAHLGQVVGSHDNKEKQQGVLNVLSSVLATAAALTGSQQNQQQQQNTPENQVSQSQQQNQQQEALTAKIIELTNVLLNELEAENNKMPLRLPDLLGVVQSIKTPEGRQAIIDSILHSAKLAQQYITELFTTAYNYISEKTSQLSNYIKEQINAYYASSDDEQAEDTAKNRKIYTVPFGVGLYAQANKNLNCTVSADLKKLTDIFITTMWQCVIDSVQEKPSHYKAPASAAFAFEVLTNKLKKHYQK